MTRPVYPLPTAPNAVDRLVQRVGTFGPMRCPVCARPSVAVGFGDNLRETGRCRRCAATNRQRQMAAAIAAAASEISGRRVRDLPAVAALPGIAIYNTEAQGPVHEHLRRAPGYRCSEYLGPGHAPGERVGDVYHEDLMGLSFPDDSFDLVISSDVFEHVPEPYLGHREVLRVLRPGGRHVFTVPFLHEEFDDDVRARLAADDSVEHLAPPIYHDTPERQQDILVFTIFGFGMMGKLEELGFKVRMYRLWDPRAGIFGCNGVVFEAVKQ